MSVGRVLAKSRKKTGRVPSTTVSEYAQTVPMGMYGAIVIRECDREAVARMCERREGPDSEIARMLDVAGVLA